MKRWCLFPILLITWVILSSCAAHNGAKSSAVSPSDEEFWHGVAVADVVYVGEFHGDRANHEYELDLIRGMARRGIRVAVGWEMFYPSQQTDLGRFDPHKLSLGALGGETHFAKACGRYF